MIDIFSRIDIPFNLLSNDAFLFILVHLIIILKALCSKSKSIIMFFSRVTTEHAPDVHCYISTVVFIKSITLLDVANEYQQFVKAAKKFIRHKFKIYSNSTAFYQSTTE